MIESMKHPRLLTFATVFLVLAALHLASDVLIPVALAALISFAFAPVVVRLQRWIGRVPAVLTVVVLFCGAVGGLGYLVAGQLNELAQMVPQYRENIIEKLGSLRVGIFEKAKEAVKEIEQDVQERQAERKEIEAILDGDKPPRREAPEFAGEPMRVEVVEPEPTTAETLLDALGPLMGPLGTSGMVIVLVIFILLARQDLRDRTIRLIGSGRIRVTTQAMDEAAQRVSQYLLMQIVINVSTGVAVGIGMFLLGVPGFFLWGILSAVLRFVPYIGPWIAAAMPVMVALAVFDGWTWPLLVIAYFTVVELVSNNLLEPWLYGSSAGVSPLAVIVTAIFWTWLWGPVGLLLATPLTVCFVVMGKYVPQLHFVRVLFGDEPMLEPHARFYQRLISGDQDEASKVSEASLAKHRSLADAFDDVLLPALTMAEIDRHTGEIDERRIKLLQSGLREIVADMAELAETQNALAADAAATDPGGVETRGRSTKADDADERPAPVPLPALPASFVVQVIPAHDEADVIAGEMLAVLVRACGATCETVSLGERESGLVDVVQQLAANVVVVSAVPPSAVSHLRHVHKRLRARFPDVPVVLGSWRRQDSMGSLRARVDASETTPLVTSLRDAVVELARVSRTTSRPVAVVGDQQSAISSAP